MADGSVEIRVTGSVDPSVAASANEAKAAYTGLGDSIAVSASAMAAALAATGGNLRAIRPEMLGLATAAKTAAVSQGTLAAATASAAAATEVGTAATINSRAAYESLVLVHEALSGRFTRMAGSSMILTQQLAGQAAISSAVAFATSGVGLAVLGTVAVLGAAVVATLQYEAAEKKLITTAIGLGAASGLTAEQLAEAGRAGANWSSQSISQTTKAAEAFAAAGVKSESEIEALSSSVETYAQLTGVKFADAQKTLAEAMKDPVKGAKDLHEQLGILDGDQIEQIKKLTDLGEKDQAVTVLIKAYTDRIKEAQSAGIGFAGGLGPIINGLSNMWGWLGKVNTQLREYQGLISSDGSVTYAQHQRDVAQAVERRVQAQTRLNDLSVKGSAAFDSTPEGRSAQAKAELSGKLHDATVALQADMQLHGAHSDAVKRDRQAIEDYTHAVSTYLAPAEKAHQIAVIDDQLAVARHAHNKQLIDDLTTKKKLLEESGNVESNADARRAAADAGATAGDRAHMPKGKKAPDIVSEWTEQLHAAEIASNDFFSDQTEAELAFWQKKLGLTKAGSKDWLDVQTKIYDAQKTLAHRDYDEHLADLNDKLQADRDNWAKEQGDWQQKLDYIKAHYTAESTEYKNAYREYEAAERQHQDQILQAQLSGEQKQLAALKTHLQAEQQIRQTNAGAAEAIIKSQADRQILGEISAASQIGQIHHQLAEQEIADAVVVEQAELASGKRRLAAMIAAGKGETEAFRQEKAAQEEAERAAQDKIAQLQAKAAAQSISDILAVKTAYHSYVDGLVSSTTSAFTGILSRTQTWQQAMSSVFNSLLSTIDQVLSKMLSNWIVTHVLMTSSERAQLATQQAQHAAAEAAKTTATATGATARTTAETAATTATATEVATQGLAEITSAAAVAGANAFAATAAIPIVGPGLAPAAAAAADAAVMAMAPQAVLATGTNYLPNDMIVQAHEGERVIPKADNRQIMEQLRLGAQAATGNAPGPSGGGGGGDGRSYHYHDHTERGLSPSQIDANRGAFAKAMIKAHREGMFSKAPGMFS